MPEERVPVLQERTTVPEEPAPVLQGRAAVLQERGKATSRWPRAGAEVDDRAQILDVERPEAEAAVEANGRNVLHATFTCTPAAGARATASRKGAPAVGRGQPPEDAAAGRVQVRRVFRRPGHSRRSGSVQGDHRSSGVAGGTGGTGSRPARRGIHRSPVFARERGRVPGSRRRSRGLVPFVEGEAEVRIQEPGWPADSGIRSSRSYLPRASPPPSASAADVVDAPRSPRDDGDGGACRRLSVRCHASVILHGRRDGTQGGKPAR